MAKKKKGDLKLIMPKHTASVDHFRLSLKVCLAHPSGVMIEDFKNELFAELHAAGLEAIKNRDGSHYTKCLQLPRYFGMVKYCLSGERANAITARGRAFYAALTANPIDQLSVYGILYTAIASNMFGRKNEGVGSESFCEPLAIFFRAVDRLNGITNSEYGYLIQAMDLEGRPFKQIINEIEEKREAGTPLRILANSQAHNISDWKTILFLVNVGFLVKDADGMVKFAESTSKYKERLSRLPLYSSGYKFQLYRLWLGANGLTQSMDNYPKALFAISEDFGNKDSACFNGFFKCLTGHLPRKKIFSVGGLQDYDRIYGELNRFWEIEPANGIAPFREDSFYECYFYANAPKCIDNKRLFNACTSYKKFLAYWDNCKNVFEVNDEEVYPMFKGNLGEIQKIVYGAPGTGKSFDTDEKLIDGEGNPKATVFRTTFHPDSDYSTFVGTYKPTSIKVPRIALDGTTVKKAGFGIDITADQKKLLEQEDHITYSFRPQAFMNAYVAAWKDITKSVVLIIEEINRGNCAQIFGDLFQLLDRDDRTGYSTYPITADTDLKKWLAEDGQFGPTGLAGIAKPDCIKQPDWDGIIKGEMLALPPNLYIWATMNTSDQSLFPIDSAFKRRWDWKYVPIRKGKFKKGPKKGQEMAWKIKVTVPAHQEGEQPVGAKDYTYDWWDFLKCVNTLIFKTTDSEDKKLGYFFVKPDGKSDPAADDNDLISADRFVGKVIFYLWNDVFKDYGIETIFKAHEAGKKSEDGAKGVEFQAFFNESDDEVNVTTLLAFFKQLELKSDEEKAAAGRAQNNQGAAQNNQGTAQNNQGAEQNNPPAQDGGGNPEA